MMVAMEAQPVRSAVCQNGYASPTNDTCVGKMSSTPLLRTVGVRCGQEIT
eukprot:NODE_4444_length_470_cov_19.869359_g3823_i0.p1 GENE.NODE_4444_length_470_cov_19.869359_g3823_i0~~NODE_4444_length_470_cov_19.869359_g3823_i0.p1  ORF type:complete len:50 (-),score=2.06 NODE_4444_length_470_cov_19.869359_g3823_i0:117-266(-)